MPGGALEDTLPDGLREPQGVGGRVAGRDSGRETGRSGTGGGGMKVIRLARDVPRSKGSGQGPAPERGRHDRHDDPAADANVGKGRKRIVRFRSRLAWASRVTMVGAPRAYQTVTTIFPNCWFDSSSCV